MKCMFYICKDEKKASKQEKEKKREFLADNG